MCWCVCLSVRLTVFALCVPGALRAVWAMCGDLEARVFVCARTLACVVCAITRLATRIVHGLTASPPPRPPAHTRTHFTSPQLTSPHLTSPRLTSPHLTSPHLTSPHPHTPTPTPTPLPAQCGPHVGHLQRLPAGVHGALPAQRGVHVPQGQPALPAGLCGRGVAPGGAAHPRREPARMCGSGHRDCLSAARMTLRCSNGSHVHSPQPRPPCEDEGGGGAPVQAHRDNSPGACDMFLPAGRLHRATVSVVPSPPALGEPVASTPVPHPHAPMAEKRGGGVFLFGTQGTIQSAAHAQTMCGSTKNDCEEKISPPHPPVSAEDAGFFGPNTNVAKASEVGASFHALDFPAYLRADEEADAAPD